MAKAARNPKGPSPTEGVTKSPKTAARTRSAKQRVADGGTATLSMPGPDQIRQRAFEIYLRRNGGPGDPVADWIQAERELTQELNGA